MSAYVKKSGDVMTGGLSAPSVYGTGSLHSGSAGLTVNGFIDYGGVYEAFAATFNPASSNMSVSGVYYPGSWLGVRINGGSGYFLELRGDYAYTTVGGPLLAYSDARIKTVLGDYVNGLDAVAALQPVRYKFKGNETEAHPANPQKADEHGVPLPLKRDAGVAPYETSPHYGAATDDKEYIGLIAQEVEVSMPETVKLSKAFIDGVEVTDLRTLDTGPILFALINAVKELKTRLEVLEAAG